MLKDLEAAKMRRRNLNSPVVSFGLPQEEDEDWEEESNL